MPFTSLIHSKMYSKNNSCLICGSCDQEVVYHFNELPEHKRIGPPKNIVKCQKCDLVFCSPRNEKETMLKIYENTYWHEYAISVKELPITERINDFLKISDERVSYIQKIKNKGSLLDVGCSMGFLVHSATQQGYNAFGIDLNHRDIQAGNEKFQINLKKAFLKDIVKDDYDIITSYNVIEHVSDPKQMLKEMKKRLKKDGIIVIGTHDIESNSHKNERENWKHIIPTEHMYYFSINTLDKLCNTIGLGLISTYKPIDNGFVSFYRIRSE